MAAEYKLTPFDHLVQHFHDGTVTMFRDDEPSDPFNVAYQAWLEGGGVPEPYSATQPIDASLDSVGTGRTTNQILGVA